MVPLFHLGSVRVLSPNMAQWLDSWSDLPPYGSNHGSDHQSRHLDQPEQVCWARAKKHADKKKYKVRVKYISQFQRRISPLFISEGLPQRAPSEQDQTQHDPDPVFYREVDMSDLLSQYTEEIETFRHVLDLPDPRETMPTSSTSVLGLDDVKCQQELRPRGHLAMLPLSPYLKDAFDKFEQDFQASNLPEGKYINPLLPLQSDTRWGSLVLRTKFKN